MQNHSYPTHAIASTAAALALCLSAMQPAAAQTAQLPVSAQQRATAQQVAARGVPLSELSAKAPDRYVVKRGDTLWGISGLFLKRPWRWPELWGMNMQAIANPHLIYPGQTLYLEKSGGYARLSTSRSGDPTEVRLSPRVREGATDDALPTLQPHLIEPFLVEPLVVDDLTVQHAPRIVAAADERVILGNGDRAYARGAQGYPLEIEPGASRQYRVFRNAMPLKDPNTGEILGYEAQFVGRAELVRSESLQPTPNGKGQEVLEIVPATLDLSGAREEFRIGDRLLPAPQRSFTSYVPRAPEQEVQASVVSIYGSSAVANAGQNQVVAINKGTEDGMQAGHVLRLMTKGDRMVDKTDEQRTRIKLPSEPNGLAMVFLTFDRVSYALILQSQKTVRVGDSLVNPQ